MANSIGAGTKTPPLMKSNAKLTENHVANPSSMRQSGQRHPEWATLTMREVELIFTIIQAGRFHHLIVTNEEIEVTEVK